MENRDGPGMVLRPALPNAPKDGVANASLLKKPVPPVTPAPVASARLAPKFPLPPESDRLPSTRAVKGRPLMATMFPATIHERRMPVAAGLASGRFFPTGDCSVNPRLNEWR